MSTLNPDTDPAIETGPIDIETVIASLTLEQKASLLRGNGFWYTQAIAGQGDDVDLVPSVMVTDGPHGLRKQAPEHADHLGLGNSIPATCFPTAAALASTWDENLLHEVGEALGRETAANDVAVLLGPGINIKRSPLCGRNFEYFSEDPVVAGNLGAALIEGVQSQGVGTSLKHFAANNQETDRLRVSVDVDERTLREIYLAGFERAVKRAKPLTVMCSYNKINGTYASQNHWLLTEILREEWGFDGLVVSDWGAVQDRVPAVAAGLDLEMPQSPEDTPAQIVEAVRSGVLDEKTVDASVRRLLTLLNQTLPAVRKQSDYDRDAHHALARKAAAAGVVLLKNDPVGDTPLLPIDPHAHAVVIGEFARTPRYQGAGSSQVVPTLLDNALDALRAMGGEFPFAPGFTIGEGPEGNDDALRAEAVELARGAGTVLLFLGLPAVDESEGYDRIDFDLPDNQLELINAIAEVNDRIVVVLSNGSAVSVSEWVHRTPALLEAWLGGQAGGSGIADVLTGVVNPSAKLTETIPLRLENNPSYGNFPGAFSHVSYGEGVFVGYRWYDTHGLDVAFPFGHGLSYTAFAYDDVTATVRGSGPDVVVDVSVRVTNSGNRTGAEVVQVYVEDPVSSAQRPLRELKAFDKIELAPGESRTVSFTLNARDLSYWHSGLERWVVEGGEFIFWVGASSRDLRGSAVLDIEGEDVRMPLTQMSTVNEAMSYPAVAARLKRALGAAAEGGLDSTMLAMVKEMPLKSLANFGLTALGPDDLAKLIANPE